MAFKEISTRELQINPFSAIGDEWMLVAAGTPEKFNMMTASWGSVGEMWSKPVAVTVIRPQRYTDEFVKDNDYFTLSFYGDNKQIHKVCGSKSGRDVDKVKETGLIPVFDNGSVYLEQARLVLVCKKMFSQTMDPAGIIDQSIDKWYPDKDYHNVYVGEIVKVLVKE